ncbi:MAG TPA: acetylglutamate kinase [Firmicutes bacterium]|nr:acetylglutamate kinase [Bacillota bacterium]
MHSIHEKAGVLIEALPYIRLFFGKTVVIKLGGSAMTRAGQCDSLAQDIVLLRYIGLNPVVVHGGGPEISAFMERLGLKPRFVNGRRVTDESTMEVVEMVLCGKLNKEIVSLLNKHGGKAVGLSGKDGNLILARKDKNQELGQVGEVAEIHPEVIKVMCREGFIPVIAPVAQDENGVSYNINADIVAGHLAPAVGADKLIMLTDVEGILREQGDPASLISTLTIEEAREMLESGKADRGMIPKLEGCIAALSGGVPRAHIIDGRVPHALLLEIFTNKGIGTMVIGGQGR